MLGDTVVVTVSEELTEFAFEAVADTVALALNVADTLLLLESVGVTV